MSMLIGTFYYKMDSKGRVPIPAAFREYLDENYPEEEFVLVIGLDKNLFLHPKSQWLKYSKSLKNRKKYFNLKIRKIDAFLNANSSLVNCDKQGRILIPEFLRTYAELDSKVVIVGNQNWIEIWSEENWKKFMAKFINSQESIQEMENLLEALNDDDEE